MSDTGTPLACYEHHGRLLHIYTAASGERCVCGLSGSPNYIASSQPSSVEPPATPAHTEACRENFDRLTIGRPADERMCICSKGEPPATTEYWTEEELADVKARAAERAKSFGIGPSPEPPATTDPWKDAAIDDTEIERVQLELVEEAQYGCNDAPPDLSDDEQDRWCIKHRSMDDFCSGCRTNSALDAAGNLIEKLHAALVTERQQHADQIAEKNRRLAECFRWSGADPDGNEDWRLAEHAVTEVRRLREESDAESAAQQTEIETKDREFAAVLRAVEAERESWRDDLKAAQTENERLTGERDGAYKAASNWRDRLVQMKIERDDAEREMLSIASSAQVALEAAAAEITRLTAERDTLKALLQRARQAFPDSSTAGPDGTGYSYAWDECTGDEQEWVKGEVEAILAALASRPHTQEPTR